MRARGVLALGLTVLVVAACISVVQPTQLPTEPFTPAPTLPPTLAPTPPPTLPATDAPTPAPTPTLAPGQTPLPTPVDLRPFLSAGVTLYNLGDSTLFVTATGIDPDTGDEFALGSFDVEPEQFTRQAAIPLLIRFDFSFDDANVAALATCTMNVATGSEVDFVAVAGGVAVTVNQVQPVDISEMVVGTSSLCQSAASQ